MDERLDEPFVQRLITKTFDKLKIENDGDFCGMDVSATKSKGEKRYAAQNRVLPVMELPAVQCVYLSHCVIHLRRWTFLGERGQKLVKS